MNHTSISYIEQNTSLPSSKIRNVLKLLIEEECTIPFITRYRKEATGGLDEVQIASIQDFHKRFTALEARREFILKKIKEDNKLTPALEKDILKAKTIKILDDLYAPFKSKRKTKAQTAIENGLAPLALKLKTSQIDDLNFLKNFSKDFFNNHLKTNEDISSGLMAILTEEITQNVSLKETLRDIYKKESLLTSSMRKKAKEISDYDKYKDYFEFSQKISQLKNPKTSHRYLAIRRGMDKKVLSAGIEIEKKLISNQIEKFHPWIKTSKCNEMMSEILKLSSRRIHSSLELEMMGDLKSLSDEAAIQVFSTNLKDLLLQPYLGAKTVLGIDPGVRTGCKVALINQSGEFMMDTVIYPHPPRNEKEKSIDAISRIIHKFNVEYIAIGNGTYGRETLALLKSEVASIKNGDVKTMLVNEDGASIYSASEIAREEFPDKDPTVRGAISIARRFQDPLAELVKIDPKSIGVGQYQHDVNQVKLKQSLETAIENCVNYVGVDLNTASAPLLSYISGIGPKVSSNITKYREKIGGFKKRSELLKVSRFSEKVFQQAGGFLRIYNGENPLDATFIHPESYPIIQDWCAKNKIKLSELIKSQESINKLEQDQSLKEKLGSFTHQDILSSLRAPRQDPRDEFKAFEFKDNLNKISDIHTGDMCPGIVTNITKFGAFIDIGIKENGLIHVSQMADKFVDDPFKILKIGQKVNARVLEVDLKRGRISLSLKTL